MNRTELLHLSRQQRGASSHRYETVDLSVADYTPSEAFKGLFCKAEGDVIIEGADDVDSPAMPLTVGIWPLGGTAIRRTGTTATLVALF